MERERGEGGGRQGEGDHRLMECASFLDGNLWFEERQREDREPAVSVAPLCAYDESGACADNRSFVCAKLIL